MLRTPAPRVPAVRPCLFRLLLCALLLLNGIGSAMASVHVMQMEAAASAGMAHSADADCPHAAAGTPAPPADDGCLERCVDICMQHAPALPVGHVIDAAPAARQGPAVLHAQGPASKQPYPPLRPPIPV
jgi:hypothetical protein